MRLSVIVPTLNEAALLGATLTRVREMGVDELIIVDGGSTDATQEVAATRADRVLTAGRGRASQMNAGAAAASGDVLVFLHADTLVPDTFATAIREACAVPSVVGGRFDVGLDPDGPFLRLTAVLMNWRSRLTGIATGDQAIFIRRDTFTRLGGYADIPLMEDIDLSRRMKRAGRIACLRARVTTSSRRWQRNGIVRTILQMWTLRALYWCGASPQWLQRRYADTR